MIYNIGRMRNKTIITSILFIILAFIISAGIFLYSKYTVPILMYHSFEDNKKTSLSVSPQIFYKQMEFLYKNNYHVIPLKQFVSNIKKGVPFSHRTVVITIDDGLADNYKYAYPVLKRFNFPATIFLIAGYVGEKNEYLNWQQVREMQQHKITFGSHTMFHAYLPSIKDQKRLEQELFESKKIIEKNTGQRVEFFCYPTGGFNKKIIELLKKAGYSAALTTNRGTDRFNKDLFELDRVKITDSDMTKPFSFRAKLSGYYNLFRHLKKSG